MKATWITTNKWTCGLETRIPGIDTSQYPSINLIKCSLQDLVIPKEIVTIGNQHILHKLMIEIQLQIQQLLPSPLVTRETD